MDALPGPSQGAPSRASDPMSKCETHEDESLVVTLQITCQIKRITAKVCIHYASHKWDVIGHYREKAKMEKRMDLGDLGRKNCGKIERDKRDK